MVDEEDKTDDEDEGKKFAFDSAGEAVGYISLEQARILAVRHARENTDFYGRRYSGRSLVWEVVGEEEGEDYYFIRLSFRPASGFRGEPGLEQLTIDKAGPVELREILREPVERKLRTPLLLAGLVVAVAVVGVVVGLMLAVGDGEAAPPPQAVLSPRAPVVSAPVTVPVQPDTSTELVSPQGAVTIVLAAGSVQDPVRAARSGGHQHRCGWRGGLRRRRPSHQRPTGQPFWRRGGLLWQHLHS